MTCHVQAALALYYMSGFQEISDESVLNETTSYGGSLIGAKLILIGHEITLCYLQCGEISALTKYTNMMIHMICRQAILHVCGIVVHKASWSWSERY
jgi:hypothetical protein